MTQISGEPSVWSRVKQVPRWLAVAVLTAVVLIACFFVLRLWSTEDVAVRGVDHPVRSQAVADGAVRIEAGDASEAKVTVDGHEVPAEPVQGALVVHQPALPDGQHEMKVTTPRALSWLGSSATTREFTVDSAPPQLQVDDSLRPDGVNKPVTVRGVAKNATQVMVGGNPVNPDPNGGFSAVVPHPDREVQVVASDAAGNRAEKTMTVHVKDPGMHAVHMTGIAWATPSLRDPVLDMIRQHKIDTVELDLKDEDGEVTYDSNVPMANQVGATKHYYKARQTIDQLHQMGVRVVGRVVAFKDPLLAKASWGSGRPERVVQDAQGQPWSGSGAGPATFTNFADPVVRQYNIDIASDAATLGFDDVLYDYVRRPDGGLSKMRFPELNTTPETSIAEFLRQTETAVRSKGARLGASVFGIAVNRPTQIAQDIAQMSKWVDYISPMVYPSHWGPGEFGVSNPNSQPYDIVHNSLNAFAKAVQGTDVQIIPWLQDFSLGASYGPQQVDDQIRAAHDDGMPSFLLWAPNCKYHGEALAPLK